MRRLILGAGLIVASLTVASLAPAAGAADGARDVKRFAAGGRVQHVLIDADARGRATATWIRIGREREAWTSDFDGRSWSCPTVLPDSKGALGYWGASWDLAEADSGAAVLGGARNSDGTHEGVTVWTRAAANRPWVQVRWSEPDGFAILQRTGPPSVALTGSVALVSWVATDSQTSNVYAAKIPVGSTAKVTPTLIFSSATSPLDTDPDVGIDAQGNALIQFEAWIEYTHPLYLTKWPAGGAPATSVLKNDVLTKDYLTSMHVNAAGQMVTSWGYAPDGASQYEQWVGLGSTAAGLTEEAVWQAFGADGVYSYPETVGSDIDASGNVALMLVYEKQLVGGLGTVAGGVGSLAPRASTAVTLEGENWDVTIAGGRAMVAYGGSGGTSYLDELSGAGFTTLATAGGTVEPNSALVKVAGAMVPSLVGSNPGGTAFRTTLPNRVKPCPRT